jgi:heat-inducible transcriptional repressor
MLTERAGTVLKILVSEYINNAIPVASDEIARRSPVKVSPATIRSAMSQLTEEGYISRPHVSAGAVPCDRGYRYYVESWKEPPELPVLVQRQIYQHFDLADPDMEVWSQQCAAILSRLATNLAIVTVPWARSPRLKQIQLVYLEEFLALLIIVLQETRLLRRLLPLDEASSQDSLNRVANKLNQSLGDLQYRDIEASQLELTPLEEKVKNETTQMLKEASSDASPEHYVDGLRWLLNQPEFAHGGRAKDLVEMLEERVLLEGILSEMPQTGDVAVYIGGENREASLRPFGVIICQYGMPHQSNGTICVIGPTRMGYAEAIGGVTFLSSFMSRLVKELHTGSATG